MEESLSLHAADKEKYAQIQFSHRHHIRIKGILEGNVCSAGHAK
jgi:hypothetical protein